MTGNEIDSIVKKIMDNIQPKKAIPIEASARHVHLSKKHVEELFGAGYELNIKKELSQPGQYQYEERVTLIGPRGILKNVAILGPPRYQTQVELSKTDAVALGIRIPVRDSGNLEGSGSIFIASDRAVVRIEEGVIAAKRHIHMTEEDALEFKVANKQIVRVEIMSDRPLVFDDVLIRVSKNFRLSMHIDYDEANASGFEPGVFGRILT